MASEYGRRPSEILGVEDEWAAYQLDVAVMKFGRHVEGELAKGRKGKRLQELLDGGARERGVGVYRRWSAMGVTKMKIPDSGIW